MLDRAKACTWDPSSSSVVHPSLEDEQRVPPGSVNRAKVMELLGVRSPKEQQEIDRLFSRSSKIKSSASTGEDTCDEDDDENVKFANLENAVALPRPHDPSHPAQMMTTDVSNVALHKCLADMSLVLSNPNLSGKSSPFQPHAEKVGHNIHNVGARQENIFPLPPPYTEKHLLPSPKQKEVSSPIAHPLPQPPLARSSSDQPSGTQVMEREENTMRTYSFLSLNEPGIREVAPLPSISKAAQVYPLETMNPRVGILAHKFISPAASPKESPRPCHLLPSPPGGGSNVNSPSPSKPPCLPGGGSTRNFPSPSPSPSLDSMPSSLPGGGSRRNFLSPSPDSMPSCLPGGGSALNSPSTSPTSKPLCPRKWWKGAILGQGTFGIVHEGLNLEDGSFFAVKVSSTEDVSPVIQHEVDLLSKLEHPNIVRYLGSSIEDGRLCIFIELVRMGSLETILRKYKQFEEKTIRTYTRQILHGLEYLHAQKTIHRDIKCANILVDVNGQVKLSDFGVAKQVGETLASSSKGTPLYMAPEVLTPRQNCYSFSADIWSLGCTVLEMADGKPPWSDLEGFGFLFKVKKGELPPMPEHLSPEGKDFVCRCLKFHAKDRPTASELLQHPFLSRISSPELSVPWVPSLRPSSVPGLNSRTCLDQPLSSVAQCTL
ncbi:hypothetical protein GOP47_0026301 [Adiantum capillus-veneris]|nr:hypothetical protein GOP47_0026301 [Adiantum capillus-veneris]